MGRKITKEERQEHSKNRKDLIIKKANGEFKKTSTKYNKPPDLKQFKIKRIQNLQNKQSGAHQTLAQKLINQSSRKLNMEDFLENMNHQPIQNQPLDELNNQGMEQKATLGFHESHKYQKQLKKLIQNCDIILEVLDARDPLSCRCKQVQRRILAMADKKIILILNKIDLIPMQNAIGWQNYLRRQYPVVLFKANLQNQSSNLSSVAVYKKSISNATEMADKVIHSNKAVGPDHLLQLIKQISKVEGNSRAVTVGLIGYPNVGKSSVINSLKRAKTCEVSAIAGSTKSLQQVKLDKQVKLLDCPGVIFQKQITRSQLVLQNSIKGSEDLQQIISAILQRVSPKQMMEIYKINEYNSTTDFLAKICRAMGKLGKGGVPEMKQGAKLIIEDWNRGKIKYFTIPPVLEKDTAIIQE